MILRNVFRLLAGTGLAVVIASEALAQGVPLPRPRPPHLAVKAPPVAAMPVPVAETSPPAQPVQTAPVQTAPLETAPLETATVPTPAPLPPPQDIPAAPAAESVVAAAVTEQPPAPAAEPPREAMPAAAPEPIEIGPAPGAQLAAASAVQTGPPTEKQTLSKVNTYFNGIRTLQGNFTQVGPDGSRADGKFFLSKPGKVRFYYQRPSTTDIIADGSSVVVRDRKLATQDVYPLSQTPLRFLLDPNLDLARDSKVVAVHEEPGLVSVAIEESTTFGGKARVLLVFGSEDQERFELKQWTITDPQGLDTTVAVSELDASTKPDDKLFKVDYTRDITRN